MSIYAPNSAPTLTSRVAKGVDSDGRGMALIVCVHENQRGELRTTDVATLSTTGGGKPGQGYPAVMDGAGVRRLTPLECERLQGFDDHWTAGQSDAQRYRQLGNAVAIPVVEWIARRLVSAR